MEFPSFVAELQRGNLKLPIIGCLALGIFVADWFTPVGIGMGTFYIVVVLATFPFHNALITKGTIVSSIILVLLGMWVSPPGFGQEIAIINRWLSIFCIIITGFIVLKNISAQHALQNLKINLETKFGLQAKTLKEQNHAMLNLLDDIERVKHRLEEKERRLHVLIDAFPSGMLIVDPLGRVVFANKVIEMLFGYSEQELIGQSIDRLVPNRLQQEHSQHRAGFLQDPTARAMGVGRDLFACRKDGSEFPVEIGLNPIETPEGLMILSSIVDITERKRREDNFRLVVESAPSGMVMVDSNGLIVLVNSLVEQMFGYSREELLQQPIECLVPERFQYNHPRLKASYLSNPQTRVMGAGRDLFARRKDGSEFPVEIGLNPIETPEGLMVLSSIVDITSRKNSEAELERLNQQLITQNQELEAYAYAVSHDLRAPLRAIHNYADFLFEDVSAQLLPELHDHLNGMTSAVREAEELVSDLLELARLNIQDSPPRPCHIGKIIQKILLTLKLNDDLQIQTPSEWPTILGQEYLLRQIFQNLILNGIKFNRSSPRHIEVNWRREKIGFIRFSVRDNGIGILPQYQSQIFQIFQRLHTTREFEGTGIGLAIVKKAATKLGGDVSVESEIGKGSIFSFTVPTGEFRYDG
jgi:PAS domain S-box-containing protein